MKRMHLEDLKGKVPIFFLSLMSLPMLVSMTPLSALGHPRAIDW